MAMRKQIFPDWLQARLDEKGWTQADLCRASGGEIKSGSLADIMTGRRELGKKLGQAIARALRVPAQQVFQAAGYFEDRESDDLDEMRERIKYRLDKTKDRDRLTEYNKILEALEPNNHNGGTRVKRESTA